MSLGVVAYEVGGARPCSSIRKEVSMATLQVAPAPGTFALNCSVELYTYRLIHVNPSHKEDGRVGRKIALKWQASDAAKVALLELQASDYDKSHKMAPVRGKCHSV